MFNNIIVSILAVFCSSTVLSYKIDESCTNKGIEIDVRNAMTSAFDMVDASLRRLNANPYDQETTDLIERLFIAKAGQDPNDRNRMSKVRLIFQRINAAYRDEVTASRPPRSDVTIFCDDSRMERSNQYDNGKVLYRDKTNGQMLLYNAQACKGKGAGEYVALAITNNAEERRRILDQYVDIDKPTQIQLCPWFVDWIKDKKFKTGNDVARSNIGKAVIHVVEKTNWGLRQIDAFSLFDKVLLHEMTHGRSAWDEYDNDGEARIRHEGTIDVQTTQKFLFWTLSVPAYGWKWARQLAKTGDDVNGVDDWKLNAADHNADSIALFGSVAKLLDGTNPRRVEDDGRIVPI